MSIQMDAVSQGSVGVNARPESVRMPLLLLPLFVLLTACGTAKSLQRVRQADPNDGIAIEVSAAPAVVGEHLPELLRTLSYQDITTEAHGQGGLHVLAATPSSWESFGHGVRIVVADAPQESSPQGSSLRLVFARRLPQNGSENLELARERLVTALRERFGGPQ